MKEIRINVKSTPEYKEFLPRIKSGIRNIEIQLINRMLTKQEYIDTEKAIKQDNVDISVVHTPLVKIKEWTDEIALNFLLLPGYTEMFENTCKYAEYIAGLEGKRIKVVVHNNYSKATWMETNLIKEKIGPILNNVLQKYENIDLVIENSCATDNKRFKTVFDMEDVSYVVSEINKIVGNRAKTLLDTCHMMMSCEAWKRMSGEDILDWDKVFKDSTMYTDLGLIHLNNIWDNGFKEDHGRPFSPEHDGDIEKLKSIMNAYEKYTNCEISIEVAEEDYFSAPKNFITTKELLEKLGYNLKV